MRKWKTINHSNVKAFIGGKMRSSREEMKDKVDVDRVLNGLLLPIHLSSLITLHHIQYCLYRMIHIKICIG